jgi:hypothetical protein
MIIKEFILKYNEYLPTQEQISFKLKCTNDFALEYLNKLKLIESNKMQNDRSFEFIYFLKFYTLSIGSFDLYLSEESEIEFVFGSFHNLKFITNYNKIIVKNDFDESIELFSENDFIDFILLYHKYDSMRIWNFAQFKIDINEIYFYLNLDESQFLIKYFLDEILSDSQIYSEQINKMKFAHNNKFLNCF